MAELCDREMCTGCGACLNACPVQAISMGRDEKGYDHPSIDRAACIGCGACEKACPALGEPCFSGEYPRRVLAAAVVGRDEQLRRSTSGGLGFLLADWMLSQGGVVFGAVYDEDMRVVHEGCEDRTTAARFQGSKYVQSATGSTFAQVKSALADGKPVLYTGVACQIDGLRHYLRNCNTSKLVTVDLLCGGASSPGVFETYLKHLEGKLDGKVRGYDFRSKRYGYGYLLCEAQTDKAVKLRGSDAGFVRTIGAGYVRECCFSCRYARLQRCSDITVGDFWGLAVEEDLWRKGVSLLLVNTEKGAAAIDAVSKSLWIEEKSIDEAKASQSCALGGGKRKPKDYEQFFGDAGRLSWGEVYSRYLKSDSKTAELLDSIPAGISCGIRAFMRTMKRNVK